MDTNILTDAAESDNKMCPTSLLITELGVVDSREEGWRVVVVHD